MEMRLQRFLAQAGVASRRKAEELITLGRVKVNGRVVTELGTKVDSVRDKVEVSGRRLAVEEHLYLLLNKPRGYVTTLSDPEKRPTVMELLRGIEARVYPVGRLDFNTEGLLVFTNDGDLANGLMHPRREVQKTYRVKVRGILTAEELAQLRSGVTLDDGVRTAPAEVTPGGASTGGHNSWFEITIHEGRNRQIHRMVEALGHQVAKLERVRYAGLEAGTLRPGRYRQLVEREVETLKVVAGLVSPKRRAAKPAHRPSLPPTSSRSRGPRSRR